jgi:hypothetical protein
MMSDALFAFAIKGSSKQSIINSQPNLEIS